MQLVTYTYNPWNVVDFIRDSGHINLFVNIFSSDNSFNDVLLTLDTGAYITVLSKYKAEEIGLTLTGIYTANLTGFNIERGYDEAEIVIVPKIEVGKFIIEDVQILVPLEYIPVSAVIGENLLEYLNYTIDHDKDRIYFTKNPNPTPYINEEKGIDLSCGRVLMQNV